MGLARVAALFVETGGVYFNLPGVDPWDEERDARNYIGPWPVVAHPVCKRWGRYWRGSPRGGPTFRKGEDKGAFAVCLTAARNYGGVVEHPHASSAWSWFGLTTPPRTGGWVRADEFGGWTCYVEQGAYGHEALKPTWLYAAKVDLPELIWSAGDPDAFRKVEDIGGKDKVARRERTPPE
jgi:hypothetical protein